MKKERWLIGSLMKCSDCAWEDQSHPHAQRRAREHVARTGHWVQGEVTYAVVYGTRMYPVTK